MRKLALLACAALFAAPAAAGADTISDRYHWVPMTTTIPARGVNFATLQRQAAAGTTLRTWTGNRKSSLDGRLYTFTVIGSNPKYVKQTTTIDVVPIALRLHFPNGVVLDPTQPGCGDTVSVSDRFYKGPNFVPTPLKSNGVDVGTTQVTDAFMRAEFWKFAQNSNYHVVLKLASAVKVLDVTAPSGSQSVGGVCSGANHNIGEIDVNAYDNIVVGLSKQYAKPNQLPLVLTYNTVFTSGGCCIIGYHSAFGTPTGTQVYSVGTYNDPGVFSVPIEDIHVWTHEIGEAFNDPYVNNATPGWGHVGQVGGCQGNFEVGDPLTGTPFLLTYNGFTYHPQELAFFNWFYRTPEIGTGGKDSFEGTFTAAQGVCN